jgi:hypothetical protein
MTAFDDDSRRMVGDDARMLIDGFLQTMYQFRLATFPRVGHGFLGLGGRAIMENGSETFSGDVKHQSPTARVGHFVFYVFDVIHSAKLVIIFLFVGGIGRYFVV